MKINWFKLNRSLHRDIGYFCIGLTIVFAVSGIAVNHIDDFNPNYKVTYEQLELPGIKDHVADDHVTDESVEQFVLSKLPFEFELRTTFWQSPEQLKLFGENETNITVDIPNQTLSVERIEKRIILSAFNYLHLNEAKNAWVYFSDLYAVFLLYLSLSALFMIKGKKGVLSKRGLLVVAGFALPLFFILV